MKVYWRSVGRAPLILLASALGGSEWSASRPGRFTTRERAPCTHWIGGWVVPRAVLKAKVKRKIPNPRRQSTLECRWSTPWGREADHAPPSSAEVEEWVELYLQSPNTPSWRGAQLKHRDNFTLPYEWCKTLSTMHHTYCCMINTELRC
jgi:hypothetical protein